MDNFKATINQEKVFHSQIMIINDQPNIENGIVLIRAKTEGPPIHLHKMQEETFEVLEGSLDVYKETKWITLCKGETIHIPKGTPHSYKNTSGVDTYFKYYITPKGTFTQMMYHFEKLIKEGKLNSTKDLRSIIYLAMVFRRYNDSVSSVNPPNFVMNAMAAIGNLLGFKI